MSPPAFERTYGHNPIPTLVLHGEKIAYANRAAIELFGGQSIGSIKALQSVHQIQHPSQLCEALRESIRLGGAPTKWQGSIGEDHSQLYCFDIIPMVLSVTEEEGPSYLCRFHLMRGAREERLRLQAVLENMPMGVLLFDVDGRVLEINNLARFLVGRNQWAELGEDDHPFRVLNLRGEELRPEDWPLTRALTCGELSDDEEFILDFGETKRHLSISVIPVTNQSGETSAYLVTGKDVTKRSEQERRKDEFLSIASHELRSPLTPLAGFLQLARIQSEEGRPVDPSLLRRAESQVNRLRRLIDGLLDLSRLETGQLPIHRRTVQIIPLFQRILEPWLRGPHGDRIALELNSEPFEVYLDPDRFDQVLTNIIDNAVKHGCDQGPISIALFRDEDQVICKVRDSGHGIAPELQESIFERFIFKEDFSRDHEHRSMGLGLYICRQIVEGHGGAIRLESKPEEGTTVTIELPLFEEPC